ncbi:hypothetical protein R3P38DRAFT_2497451 [Favolaschia claudopus]|uniref:Uncharacterized protein n=1 Tax=Favolaschia claudopus TaxID=2862362 RepID=A0AAW0E128_9AGAR
MQVTDFLQDYTMDIDLCELLRGMNLGQSGKPVRLELPSSPFAAGNNESSMLEVEPSHPSETLQSRPNSPSEPPYQGCAYLQAIQSQLDSEQFPTTGGEYIESIFTHRQIFFAFPGGHRCCARAFSDLACSLQRRQWRADREGDMEAVSAFNYEAQLIASITS